MSRIVYGIGSKNVLEFRESSRVEKNQQAN
jgi:hypothetical protein